FHAPGGTRGALRAVQLVAVGRPGAGAPRQGGGRDAVLREDPAGVLGAGARGADDQDVTAVGGVPDVGQRALDLVEGDVERAGEVTAGVFAGGTHVDDG